MSKWAAYHTEQYQRDIKKLAKSHPRETSQMLENVVNYVDSLIEHDNPLLSIQYPFVHRESSGCHAITQQPLKSAAQTRLYVYAYVTGKTVYFLCAGDKQSQQRDNKYCRDFVKSLKNQ